MSSDSDLITKYVSLKQLNGCESNKVKIKINEKTKLKQKRISNELKKANKKSRINKTTHDLLSKFKVKMLFVAYKIQIS
jgi:hypothetical protein